MYIRVTPKLKELIQCFADDMTNKAAASHMDVSIKTIETQRSALYSMLGVHTGSGLVAYAFRKGWVK